MRFFTKAILRKPGKNFVNAIAQDQGHRIPDYNKTMREYAEYANTFEKMGVRTKILEADERFPDGCFVEDAYLVLGNKAIIELNPGASSRRDEYTSLQEHLPKDIPYQRISKMHTIDGGDILKDNKNIYVGLSTRTTQEAVDELSSIAVPLGYQVIALPVPDGLHLKSGMTCILRDHFVVQASFEPLLKHLYKMNPDINHFVVPDEEYFAANVLPINDKIMIPAGCPQTKAYIERFYKPADIFEVDTSEARLVDGALTCSNLLFK